MRTSLISVLAVAFLASQAAALGAGPVTLIAPAQHDAPLDCPQQPDGSGDDCPCCPDGAAGNGCPGNCQLTSAIVGECLIEPDDDSWTAVPRPPAVAFSRTDVPPNPPPIP